MHERRQREVRAGVYVIECVATGQFYVGSSSNLDERKASHWALLRRGKHHNARLQEAWVQYGEGPLHSGPLRLWATFHFGGRRNAGMPRH